MDQRKRKLEINDDKQSTINTNRSALCSTHFEDLSNEIVYEIFEYLDTYHIYKSFMNLNRRFNKILFDSIMPLEINILSLSKSTFDHYYRQLLIPNLHRIRSISILAPFMRELILLLIAFPAKLIRLESVTIDGIQTICLEKLLYYLISLPNLCSLTLIHNNVNIDLNPIYSLIFQLPRLKYCQLSFTPHFGSHLLPTFEDNCKSTSIERLCIKGICNLDHLAVFLSYLPQLRRLSIDYLYADQRDQTEFFPIILNHLTHASFHLKTMEFNQLIPIVKKLFQNLQVLHISTSTGDYLNSNQWEQLIISSMPYLRIFDLHYTDFVFNNTNDSIMTCQDLMKGFTSSFWKDKQWFFTHQHDWRTYLNRASFYTIKPFRKKAYILIGKYNQDKCLCLKESTDFNSVHQLDIRNEELMNNWPNFFPNVTELTISTLFRTNTRLIPTHLNRIVCLRHILLLNINCQNFPFNQLLEILSFTPNCHTLTLDSILFSSSDNRILNNGFDSFHSKVNENKINKLVIKNASTLETIKSLMNLCPRVEHITMNVLNQSIQSIIQILLAKNNINTRYLFSLCFLNITIEKIRMLQTLIHSDKLLDNCSMKTTDDDCYLWW